MIWYQKTNIYMFVLAYKVKQAVCTMLNRCTCFPDFQGWNDIFEQAPLCVVRSETVMPAQKKKIRMRSSCR